MNRTTTPFEVSTDREGNQPTLPKAVPAVFDRVSLLRQGPEKGSVQAERLRAALGEHHLTQVLHGFTKDYCVCPAAWPGRLGGGREQRN